MAINFTVNMDLLAYHKVSIGLPNSFRINIDQIGTGASNSTMYSLVEDSVTDYSNGGVTDLAGYPADEIIGDTRAICAEDVLLVESTTQQLNTILGDSSMKLEFNLGSFSGFGKTIMNNLLNKRGHLIKCDLDGKFSATASETSPILYKLGMRVPKYVMFGSRSGKIWTGIIYKLTNPTYGVNEVTWTFLAMNRITNDNNVTVPAPTIMTACTGEKYIFSLDLQSYNVNVQDLINTTVEESTRLVKKDVGSTYVSR